MYTYIWKAEGIECARRPLFTKQKVTLKARLNNKLVGQ